jgi:hypothetical protein
MLVGSSTEGWTRERGFDGATCSGKRNKGLDDEREKEKRSTT